MKIAPAIGVMLAVILALVVARECGYRDGVRISKALARDTRDDSTVSRLVHEVSVAQGQLRKERDSTGRVIRALRVKIAPRDSIFQAKGDSNGQADLRPDFVSQLALRDSLITSLLSGRQQDSLQLLFWQAQVAARDSLIPALQRSRDSWRREASKPRYTISDVGGGAIAGWGLAERSETAVLVGAGVILVPRLLGAVKRLF